MMWNRPDLDELTVGAIYQDSHTGELVEFVGVACVPELAGEDVAVFRFVDGGCLVATKRDYQNGQVFVPLGDVIEEDHEET